MKTHVMDSRIIDEQQIDESLAAALCKSLCECFPKDTEIFSKLTYWRSVPSYRVVFEDEGRVVSHIAVIDRTIAAGREQVRVAGIQSVFVLPQNRGGDLSEKMFSLVFEEARRRKFDFSLLFCAVALEKLYRRFGYDKLNDAEVRFVDSNGNPAVKDYGITMHAPVCRDVFPQGDINLKGNTW